jgi:hypothetical protein
MEETGKEVTRRKFMKILTSASVTAAAYSLLPFNPLPLLRKRKKTKIKDEKGNEVDKVPVGRPSRG